MIKHASDLKYATYADDSFPSFDEVKNSDRFIHITGYEKYDRRMKRTEKHNFYYDRAYDKAAGFGGVYETTEEGHGYASDGTYIPPMNMHRAGVNAAELSYLADILPEQNGEFDDSDYFNMPAFHEEVKAFVGAIEELDHQLQETGTAWHQKLVAAAEAVSDDVPDDQDVADALYDTYQ